MIFKETKLKGAYLVEIERKQDERGFFARSFCQQEFQQHGINFNIVQCNISFNKNKGTLRGMHYQSAPYEEAKLVSCIKGKIYDVIIDLRLNSPTYCKWLAVELSAQNYTSLYIPQGFAHGFQALEDDTIVFYQMSEVFLPEASKGIQWNDPCFSVNWPLTDKTISVQDTSYSLFKRKDL